MKLSKYKLSLKFIQSKEIQDDPLFFGLHLKLIKTKHLQKEEGCFVFGCECLLLNEFLLPLPPTVETVYFLSF